MLFRLCAAILLALAAPAFSQGWLYAGSDVTPDPAWRMGTLPNGLRYAVRRNALPAGSVSIRLRIDAGALMERPDEAGYAHFVEHMVFRGSAGVPDGEGVRIWARLGASFGQDTNAFTTATQTFYALDLPRSDPASLGTAMATLAGMMRQATIDPKLVEVERQVVRAELDLRFPPIARRVQAVSRPLFLAGTRARDMEIGGTAETLATATAPRLRAFYDRWYRPERATIVIAGDAEPDALIGLVTQAFGDWTGKGDAPADPDFGRPETPPATAALMVDRQAANGLALVWPRPHDDRPVTVARVRDSNVRVIAARILGRRLTAIARRANAPFTSASVSATEGRRIMDQTNISVANRQGQWREAMTSIYGVLAESVAEPPSRAEIDREVAVIVDGLDARVANEATARSPALASELMQSVDAGSVVTPAAALRALFEGQRAALTPETVGMTMRLLTQGEARVMMTAPVMPQGGEAAFHAALAAARATRAEARIEAKAVSFADLGKPPTAGMVVSQDAIADLGITRVRFANGVELVVKPTDFEKDRVLATVAVGWGVAGLPLAAPSPTWTAGAVMQGGAGPFDIDAMERLTAGRRIAIAFGPDERSFDYSGATNARDLPDTLRLMATAIAEPRLDADAFARMKSQLAGSYESIFSAPGNVFGVMSGQPLHDGDVRWAFPARPTITGLPIEAWRGFWQPILAAGPRRVVIVGDVTVDAAIRAVAASIGAAQTRPAPPPGEAQLNVLPRPAGAPPVTFNHRGDPAQLLLAATWPTQGVLRDVRGARALSVAAVIFQTRLFDRFRETEGGTYSPSVSAAQSQTFPRYGLFMVASQLRAERREDFLRAIREIAADLSTKGPTADEVARATAPIASKNERAARTNGYWAAMLERDLDDPRVLDQIRTNVTGYQAVSRGDVRKAARRWLKGRAPATILVASAEAAAALP